MLVHCDLQLQIAIGKLMAKDVSRLGTRTIGKFIVLHFEFMILKNLPTVREIDLSVNNESVSTDFKNNKIALKNTIDAFCNYDENVKALDQHPVLGSLTKKQWGRLAYIHLNYHLRQFGQ